MQELQPQLAELLRTCVHPPSLLLRIVHVKILDQNDSKYDSYAGPNDVAGVLRDDAHRYAVKYLVSDGKIMMQALLHRKLSVLREVTDVTIGDLLDIRSFAVKKSRRLNGEGHVVYLAIDDCHFLRQPRLDDFVGGKVESEQPSDQRSRKRSLSTIEEDVTNDRKRYRTAPEDLPGGFVIPTQSEDAMSKSKEVLIRTETPPSSQIPQVSKIQRSATTTKAQGTHLIHSSRLGATHSATCTDENDQEFRSPLSKKDGKDMLSNTFGARRVMFDDEDDGDDFFESLPTNRATGRSRRTALQKLNGNAINSSQLSAARPGSGMADMHSPELSKARISAYLPTLLDERPPISKTVATDVDSAPFAAAQKRSVRGGTYALSQTPNLPAAARFNVKPHVPQRQVYTQPVLQPPSQPTLFPCPPFHTLSSLRSPPASQPLPTKSYSLTTLAVISWTGTTTIHRPGSPFPPKRHLKIVDPSLSTSRPPSRQIPAVVADSESSINTFQGQNSFQDAVTVAVYIDATNFKPSAGTIVLFRGLTMQRLGNGDIILNAYARLKEQRFEENINIQGQRRQPTDSGAEAGHTTDPNTTSLDSHWFITDQSKIRSLGHGSRLDYYLEWWAEKQRTNQPPQS